MNAPEKHHHEENQKGGSCPAALCLGLCPWLPSLLHHSSLCACSPTTLVFTLAQTFWLSFRHPQLTVDLGNPCSDSDPDYCLTLTHHSVLWLFVVMVTCPVTVGGSQPTFTGGAVRSACPTATPA